MHVDDFAALAVEAMEMAGSTIVDAVGPETFEYRTLTKTIAEIIGVRRPMVSVPAWVGLGVTKMLNPMVKDTIITRQEIEGLMRGLLFSDGSRVGATKLTDWAMAHRNELGRKYASEVGRRVNRVEVYERI